ncbi:unnamed protein product, partial [marine sediment metagenome]
HTSGKEASVSGAVMIYAVQVHANDAAADVELTDALTDTGTDELKYSALDGDTLFFDYTKLGGIAFATGLTVVISAGAVTIWTDKYQAT